MRAQAPLLALSHERTQMRVAAPEALRTRSDLGPDAVPYLAEALGNRHWRVKDAAASALSNIGRDAWEAIPALIEAWDFLGEGARPHEWGSYNFALIRITLGGQVRVPIATAT